VCGIVGSRDPRKLLNILDELSTRGTRAFSVTLIDLQLLSLVHQIGMHERYSRAAVETCIIEIAEEKFAVHNPYWIVHLQSPTAINYSFHPARDEATHYSLWHNGMLESSELEKFKDDKGDKPWDTELLLNLLTTGDMRTPPRMLDSLPTTVDRQQNTSPNPLQSILPQIQHLQKFQGSFACLYLIKGQGLYAFRNRIAPMFHDEYGTVCSIMFSGAEKMDPNTVYVIPSMEKICIFIHDYNPFGV